MHTSKLAHTIVSSAFLLALNALGAACAVEPEDASIKDESLGEASQALGLVDDAQVYRLPELGGTGGFPYSDTMCPDGYVATGFQLRVGTWVNNISMTCRQINPDGSLGATALTVGRGGGDGEPFAPSCANDQILVGQMIGTDGQYVGKLGGKCASLSRILANAGGFDGNLGPFGSNGAIAESTCPAGYAVVGFHGRAGWWTDKVGFTCKSILMPTVSLPVNSGGTGVRIAINSVSIKGGSNAVRNVARGEQFPVNVGYTITQPASSPSAVDQILVGLAPNSPAGCVYNGIPSTNGTAGSGTVTITAPSTPGLYFLRHHYGQGYSCDLTWWTTNGAPDASMNIGVINVF